jgi:hypothetical protein
VAGGIIDEQQLLQLSLNSEFRQGIGERSFQVVWIDFQAGIQ